MGEFEVFSWNPEQSSSWYDVRLVGRPIHSAEFWELKTVN